MTRFDADTPTDRRKLFADAVTAHRTRGSSFLTIEAEEPEEPSFGTDDSGEEDDEDVEEVPPWLQFAEKTFNLDVTDAEHDRLNELVDDYPEFRVDELNTPDTAEGTNVRITARSDANRLADFADRVFQEVYEFDEEYRAWVVQV
jgi:hypothetical protein